MFGFFKNLVKRFHKVQNTNENEIAVRKNNLLKFDFKIVTSVFHDFESVGGGSGITLWISYCFPSFREGELRGIHALAIRKSNALPLYLGMLRRETEALICRDNAGAELPAVEFRCEDDMLFKLNQHSSAFRRLSILRLIFPDMPFDLLIRDDTELRIEIGDKNKRLFTFQVAIGEITKISMGYQSFGSLHTRQLKYPIAGYRDHPDLV